MSTLAVSEADVWAALQVDLEENAESPTAMEPVDRAFILGLIRAATARLERLIGHSVDTFLESPGAWDGVPQELQLAVTLDVQAHYRSRLNPEIPDAYDDLIMAHRVFGFGA